MSQLAALVGFGRAVRFSASTLPLIDHHVTMTRLFHSLLQVLGGKTSADLARQLEFLNVENQILRAKLPKRITRTPGERMRLIEAGRPLGKARRGLITIVTPDPFLRWRRASRSFKRDREFFSGHFRAFRAFS